MPMSMKFIPAVATLLIFGSIANAQGVTRPSFLPDENELNRLGLTMSWWAQASVNPRRDNIEYFTADEQNVFVQSSTGIVTNFHGEQGRKLWYRLVGNPNQQSYAVTTSETEALVTVGLNLYSLKKDTGQTIWQLVADEYPSASPAMDQSRVFLGTGDGSVFAYDLQQIRQLYSRGLLPQWTVRARLWNFQAPDLIISPPIPYQENVVFVSRRGVVYSITAKEKELVWQMETGNEIHTPVGRSNDYIFVADRNSRMLCVNLASGAATWTFAAGSPIHQQPRIVNNNVYVVPHRLGLTSIAANIGAVKWKQPLATSFVTASDSFVYARDENQNLLKLDIETGEVIGAVNMRNYPLHVANDRTDRIFLSSSTGTVIALREIGSEYPSYHLYPERRPILPELAPEEEEQAE